VKLKIDNKTCHMTYKVVFKYPAGLSEDHWLEH